MRNSKILLIGMRALANEVAKNLVLAGIGSITVIDHETVREEDLGSQFFIEEEHVGQNVCWGNRAGIGTLLAQPSCCLYLANIITTIQHTES